MISDPFPLPVTLHVGASDPIVVGELVVEVAASVGNTVTLRSADDRALVDNLADLLDDVAARLRAGEDVLTDDPTEGRPADAARD